MSLFGKVFKLGFDVVTVPIEIVKDTATLGGAITDKDKPYIIRRLKKLLDDADEVRDSVDDL